jgi:antitoxin YobK
MSMTDLERAVDLIERSKEGYFHGPATEYLIGRAEQALGLSFPPSYKRFLSRLGCGSIFGEEFYGLVNEDFENATAPNGIWVTLEERRSVDLPESLIVVGSTGDGGDYAIDVSQKNSEGESPVVEWWFGNPPYCKFVAEDFGAFLWQCVQSGSRE